MIRSKRKRGLTLGSSIMLVILSGFFAVAMATALTTPAGESRNVSDRATMPLVSQAAYQTYRTSYRTTRGSGRYRGGRSYVGGGYSYGK